MDFPKYSDILRLQVSQSRRMPCSLKRIINAYLKIVEDQVDQAHTDLFKADYSNIP